MRRYSIVLLVVLLMVALAALGCGSDKSGTSGAALSPDNQTPAEMLSLSNTASQSLTAMAGVYNISVTFDADLSQVPEEERATAQGFLENPITASGTYAFQTNPAGLDLTVAASLMGQDMTMGMKLIENKAWMGLNDQWYEMPAEMEQQLTDIGINTKVDEIQQLVTDLGLDPSTWLKDLTVAGEEEINGTAVVHLTGSPDFSKMIADVVELMQSPELQDLLNLTGALSEDTGGAVSMPTAADIQEMQTTIEQLFSDATLHFWLSKADATIRRLGIDMRMTPPAGEDAQGLNAVVIAGTITMADLNKPVSVEAPASAKSFAELESALQSDTGILGMITGLSSEFGF